MEAKVETIYALSSAPGKAGVAVVRVSGPGAFGSLFALTRGKADTTPNYAALHNIYAAMGKRHAAAHPAGEEVASPPEITLYKNNMTNVPRGTLSTDAQDKSGDEIIDSALVLTFQAPRSFTGEDVVEYHCHGAPAVVQALLDVLSGQPGHRLAAPGEFTRRAFENGKMDLTEAEAVADLIDAETELQRLQALDQMGGSLSALYMRWAEELKKALAYIEAVIDFPDEDVPDDQIAEVRPALEAVSREIGAHLSDNRRGERLRNGVQVAVIGAPNAGKSSLVNALAARDVAIVSDMAGTTRDVIEVHLDIAGYPVILADTAGLRPDQLTGENAHDTIESEGIRRALDRAQNADIKILMFDSNAPDIDPHTKDLIDENSLIIFNKSDEASPPDFEGEVISLSVSTGEGLDDLLTALAEKLEKAFHVPRGTPSLTRQRHRQNVEESRDHLAAALAGMNSGALPELIAEDLRLAVRALGRITGRVDVEDLLDVIFKDFCIGK